MQMEVDIQTERICNLIQPQNKSGRLPEKKVDGMNLTDSE